MADKGKKDKARKQKIKNSNRAQKGSWRSN
jgi:hypothetical protein